MEDVQEEAKPIKNWVITALNFGALVFFDWLIIIFNGGDSFRKFLFISHLTICIGAALFTKRDGWWFAAIIVAMPVLLLVSH